MCSDLKQFVIHCLTDACWFLIDIDIVLGEHIFVESFWCYGVGYTSTKLLCVEPA